MFLSRHMFMYSILCAVYVIVRVTSEWIPYNGLWYYVSDDNDTVTYAESKEMCNLLYGRVAVLSGWPNDQNKLASFTGSTRRWIYGEPPRVIYESGDGYNIEHTDANKKYGYICDWQCHSLGVYPDKPYDAMLEGMYDMIAAGSDLRQRYKKKTPIFSTQIKIYQKWQGANNHIWCFNIMNDEDYSCKSSTHFTPYSYPYLWYDADTSDPIKINFFCHDCFAFEVSLHVLDELTPISGTFYKVMHTTDIMYVNSNNDGYLEYNSYSNLLCLTWTEYYCFEYLIIPPVGYSVEYVFRDSPIVISLSCTKNSFPTQQSTDASVERVTSIEIEVTTQSEIQSTVTYSHLLKETSAFSEMVSRTHSTIAGPLTEANDEITIFIAVGCAIGGVVIIVIISVAAVFCRRRIANKRQNDDEQNIQSNAAVGETNNCSVHPKSSNIVDSSLFSDSNKADAWQQYAQIKSPSTEYENTAVDDGYIVPNDITMQKTNHRSARKTSSNIVENAYSSLADDTDDVVANPQYEKLKTKTNEYANFESEIDHVNKDHIYINSERVQGLN